MENDAVKVRNIYKKVTNEMQKIGIPIEFTGYEYIRDSIILIIEGTDKKELYTKVANKYDTNFTSVDSSIRHAIEIAFQRSDIYDYQKKAFPGSFINSKTKRPNNVEFLFKIADIVKNS